MTKKKPVLINVKNDSFDSFKEAVTKMWTHMTGKPYPKSDVELRKRWEELKKNKGK